MNTSATSLPSSSPSRPDWPSVSASAAPLVDALVRDAMSLRLGIKRLSNGCTIVDAGIAALGGLEAGRRIAEICLGGLGHVSLQGSSSFARWPWQISVHTAHPVLACLGSQYAGWSLNCGEGKDAFMHTGSGPGRALAAKEDLYKEIGYRDRADKACLILEVDKEPPQALIDKVLRDCDISGEDLTLILTPTKSLAGTVQIVARVLEVALHKAHTLQFPLDRVVDGLGAAPLPPPGADFLTAMGRTNDAILFGGRVHLFVSGKDDDAQSLASQLSCANSRDYGRPFAEVFKAYQCDFYQIDPHLFAPAEVLVTALESGKTFRGGSLNEALLDRSFGG